MLGPMRRGATALGKAVIAAGSAVPTERRRQDAEAGDLVIAESDRAATMLTLLMEQGVRLDHRPGWIHRRVEELRVLDENTVSRRVSVDLELPEEIPPLAVNAESVPFVPLTLMAKAKLRNFDLRDGEGRAIPARRRSESSEMAADGLKTWIEDLYPTTDLDTAVLTIGLVVMGRGRSTQEKEALADLQQAREDDSVGGGAGTVMRGTFGKIILELATGYVLMVPHSVVANGRCVVKFGWEEKIERDPVSPISWLLVRLGWRQEELAFEMAGSAYARSHHCEIIAPPDTEISRAELRIDGRCVDAEGGGRARAHLHSPTKRDATAGEPPDRRRWFRITLAYNVGRAVVALLVLWFVGLQATLIATPPLIALTAWRHLRLRPREKEPHALALLRVHRGGFLPAALVTSALATALLAAGRFRMSAVATEIEASATVLALVPGLLAVYLARPGEHALASRMLVGVRFMVLISGACAISAGALLLGHADPEEREFLWTLLLCISTGATAGILLSILLPAHGRSRPDDADPRA
jgi:hypothetical protein